MKAIIEIEMDNASFADFAHLELSNILDQLGAEVIRHQVDSVGHMATARDVNGNTVARLDIVGENVHITEGDLYLSQMIDGDDNHYRE